MRTIAKLFGMRKKRPSFTAEAVDLYSTDKWNHTNMNGMKKLIKHLDVRLNDSNIPALPYNLFDDIEMTEDIINIIELVESDQVTDTYLQSIPSIQYLSMALKRLIITHEPIIPYDYYDHFLSPVANYDKLITQINKSTHYFLDYVMNFLCKLVLNPNQLIPVKYLGKTIGIYLLRAENISLYKRNDVDDMLHRQDVFARLMEKYCDIQQQTGKPKTAGDSRAGTPPLPAAPPPSIQDRSIKVTFLKPQNRPSQEFLQNFFSQYGTVVNVGLKDKLAVILFADVESPLRCLEDDVIEKLGKDYKIKYLGNKSSKDDTLNNTTMASMDTSLMMDPVPTNITTTAENKSEVVESVGPALATNQPQREVNTSSLPPKQIISSGSNKKPEVSVSGIAAVNNSNDGGGSKASTIPAKHTTTMNDSTITEDSFRLARQQPEESLGIVDVSMISRHEDHNITKITLPSGEKPAKPVKPVKPITPKNDTDLKKKLSDDEVIRFPLANEGLTTQDRVNSSFISDASSDVSEEEDPAGSVNPTKSMKIAPMLTKGDSFMSKDSSITMIELLGEGEEKDQKKRDVSQVKPASGWKTAQSTEKINVYPAPPILTSHNSFNNTSKEDSMISESLVRTRTVSSDETSLTESQIPVIPLLSDKTTSISGKSQKFMAPTPIITKEEEGEDDHSHNIVQTSYTPSHRKQVEAEESATKDNHSPSTTTKRVIKTIQVGSSPEYKNPRYDLSSGSDPVNNLPHETVNPSTVAPPLSSSARFLQQQEVEDLQHRIHYLEAKCQHYELSLTQCKEIIHQNESLFRQRLIQLELSNQQLLHDLQQQGQEMIHYKSELLNKTIYISSLESIQQSLEQQRQQLESKCERQSLATVLSQKKLIENLQLHLSVLQREQQQSEIQIQQLVEENQKLITENLSLKETMLLQEQRLQQREKEERDSPVNNFQHHYPSSVLNTGVRSKTSESHDHGDRNQPNNEPSTSQRKYLDSKIHLEDPVNHPPLSVLESLSQTELKSYLSKVTTNSGLQYDRYPATTLTSSLEGGSDGMTPILQRSELTHRLPPSFTTMTTSTATGISPTYQSYQPVAIYPPKVSAEPDRVSNTENPTTANFEEVKANHDNIDNEDPPKLSYSAQVLLNYEKQKRKLHQVPIVSNNKPAVAVVSSPPSTTNATDTSIPEESRPKEQKKTTDLSDMYAMKNYLSELSYYGRPRDQMTYYNHLQGDALVVDRPASHPLSNESLVSYESRVPSSSSVPSKSKERLPRDDSTMIEPLPSIYSMTQDLRQLTQSILPPTTNSYSTPSLLQGSNRW